MNHNLLKIINRLRIADKFNLSFNKSINARAFSIPIIKGIGLEYLYVADEPWIRQAVEKISFKRDDCFIDIGVNIGQTLLNFKSVYPDNKYVGFEPNPVCNFYVSNLIEENKLKNIALYNLALSDRVGIVTLYLQDNLWDGRGTIIKDFRTKKIYHTINVGACIGDETQAIITTENIRLIKIDVEGAELNVIKGLRKIIKHHGPYIICEILPDYKGNNKPRIINQNELQAILYDLNYEIYLIEKDLKRNLKDFKKLYEIPIHSNPDNCDYLFSPSGSEVILKQ